MSDLFELSESTELIVFDTGGKFFAVELTSVEEISEYFLKNATFDTNSILASITVSGQTIPLINLALFFHYQPSRSESCHIVLTRTDSGERYALLVENIKGKLTTSTYYPLPKSAFLFPDIFKAGIPFKESHILILDFPKIFDYVQSQKLEQ